MFSHFLSVKMWVEFFPAAGLCTGSLLLIQYNFLSHVGLPPLLSLVHFLQLGAFFPDFSLSLSVSDFSVTLLAVS